MSNVIEKQDQFNELRAKVEPGTILSFARCPICGEGQWGIAPPPNRGIAICQCQDCPGVIKTDEDDPQQIPKCTKCQRVWRADPDIPHKPWAHEEKTHTA